MPREYDFFVYMTTNRRNEVLYTGMTNDLPRRLWEHEQGESDGFTRKYNVTKLVFFEHFGEVRDAIAREKQIKGWTRAKKEMLIRTMNPNWDDLGPQLDPNYREPLIAPFLPGASFKITTKGAKSTAPMADPSTALVPRSAQDDKV